MNAISIVVPTLNEADNIEILVKRIAASFQGSGFQYEVIFIDDHSSDNTQAIIKDLAAKYPLALYKKRGSRGKSYSLLQGFRRANYDIICMIDADLQYPPESIVPMLRMLLDNKVDVVLSERQYAGVSRVRRIATAGFNLIFTRLLFGFNYDTQSGLKVFRKAVIRNISLSPTPWSFDLEFIVRALEKNFSILSYNIPFSARHSGDAKVRLFHVSYELAAAALRLKLKSSPRKIRQAYHSNLVLAEKTSNLFLFVALLMVLLAGSAVISHDKNSAGAVSPNANYRASIQEERL